MNDEQIHFLYDDNMRIMRGDLQTPIKHQELLSNLARNVGGISWRWGETQSRLMQFYGCGILSIISGLAFILGDLLLLIDILSNSPTILAHFSVVVLIGAMGIALTFGLGHFYLKEAFLMSLHSDYAIHILHNLIANGEVAEGEVLSADLTSSMNQQVEYRFMLPETNETVVGVYITSTRKIMQPNYKVAVLFLNRYVHVLL